MKRLAVVFVLATVLAGCANPKQVMVHPDSWKQVNCSAHGWGWIGAPQAISMKDQCVNNQRVLGLITIEEAEMKEGPKFDAPLSSGISSIEKPTWSSGDFWEYNINGKAVKLQVESVEPGPAYRVSNGSGVLNIFNDSWGLMFTEQNGVKDAMYSPALQPFAWPLTIGKQWNATGEMTRNGGTMKLSTHYEIKGSGKVKVPAGEFDAYYILAKNDYGARVTEMWYSPAVKSYVRAVTYFDTGKVVEELGRYDLKGN